MEKASAKATVSPNCLKYCPTVSPMLPMGTNTAKRDKEVAKIASTSSFVASSEASAGVFPISMWRKIFSTKTMASSIRKPTASDKPMRDMLFRVKPILFIKKKAATTEVGMASPPISVARISLRNR